MCRAAVLLLAALLINWEVQNEEIKVLIICTKFLWYFSSLSYHWALFPENCLIKIVALSSLVYYLQDVLICPHAFLVRWPAGTPSPRPCPASDHPAVTSNSQALLYQVMSFLFRDQFSSSNVPSVSGGTSSKYHLLQQSQCRGHPQKALRTWLWDCSDRYITVFVFSLKRFSVLLLRSVILPAPLRPLQMADATA